MTASQVDNQLYRFEENDRLGVSYMGYAVKL